jgi:hypothetical protein
VLRQKIKYSRHPHDETARWRHPPNVPVAREGRNTASTSWVSAYAASPATSRTSVARPYAGATASCTAPALLAGAAVNRDQAAELSRLLALGARQADVG